jgi:hypothetical protein
VLISRPIRLQNVRRKNSIRCGERVQRITTRVPLGIEETREPMSRKQATARMARQKLLPVSCVNFTIQIHVKAYVN